MAHTLDALSPRAALVEIARDFHARGFMWGTAGNLSVRADAEHFWITASGMPKGRLEENDFLLVRVRDGEVVEWARPGLKPSAETAIHGAIYRRIADANAILHGHSVAACHATDRAKKGTKGLRLPPLEMLKGFDIWQQNPKVDLPLFENHLDVAKIAKAIDARLKRGKPAVSALMVHAHGPTVWGASAQQAYDRFECLEFICRYLAR